MANTKDKKSAVDILVKDINKSIDKQRGVLSYCKILGVLALVNADITTETKEEWFKE